MLPLKVERIMFSVLVAAALMIFCVATATFLIVDRRSSGRHPRIRDENK